MFARRVARRAFSGRLRSVPISMLLLLFVVTGCATTDAGNADRIGAASPSDYSPPTSSGPPDPTSGPSTASAPVTPFVDGRPTTGACYALSFKQALEPVTQKRPGNCEKPHTTRTVFVGRVGRLVGGGAPIDSPAVQRAVANACPKRVAAFLGGPPQALRLSMFRPVWFTPSLDAESVGQRWYRCDVIALAAEGRLARLVGRLDGRLDRAGWQDTYGLCGTAEPGTPGFERVACLRRHSWLAISTVDFAAARYPGEAVVRARGQSPCTDVARDRAEDPLDFRWGYEWPTLEQWQTGIRYGVCWMPAS